MRKLRYFKVRLPCDLNVFSVYAIKASAAEPKRRLTVVSAAGDQVLIRMTIDRTVSTVDILEDGTEVHRTLSASERRSVRFFQRGSVTYVALEDPPRGTSMLRDLFELTLRGTDYFLEAFEIDAVLVAAHAAQFDAAKLVSAKVRDFSVYEGATGRLEITSHAGLDPAIAPFLAGAFYRMESFTYELTLGRDQGLVQYGATGTLRASNHLAEIVFRLFEGQLPE
jgi:hypothetical protein